MRYDEKMTELAGRVATAEHRAAEAEAEAAELREQLAERAEETARGRRRFEKVCQERDDLRDELDGVALPPGVAAGRRRARRIVTQSGAGR